MRKKQRERSVWRERDRWRRLELRRVATAPSDSAALGAPEPPRPLAGDVYSLPAFSALSQLPSTPWRSSHLPLSGLALARIRQSPGASCEHTQPRSPSCTSPPAPASSTPRESTPVTAARGDEHPLTPLSRTLQRHGRLCRSMESRNETSAVLLEGARSGRTRSRGARRRAAHVRSALSLSCL